jgi:hypothetical protein
LKNPKKAGRFYQKIIEDLNALQETGIFINGVHAKFSFSTLATDNLAAHQIGGYQASFSSGYFCPRCHVKFADRCLPVSSSQTAWRTSLDHDYRVRQILDDPRNRLLFGIVGPSVFETLEGFHPTTSLPADCMHDFLEGCCPVIMMALLKEASAARLITYGEKLSFRCISCKNLFLFDSRNTKTHGRLRMGPLRLT